MAENVVNNAPQRQNKEPFKSREWNLSCKLYVGNLGEKTDKYEIENIFKEYGDLNNVWIGKNPPGFAFIEYQDPTITTRAFQDIYDVRHSDPSISNKTCQNKQYQKYNISIKPPAEDRPGDWLCPKPDCFNVNFSWREMCNKCNTRNPSIKETKEERRLRIYGNNKPMRGQGPRGQGPRGHNVRGRDTRDISERKYHPSDDNRNKQTYVHHRGQSYSNRGRPPYRTPDYNRSYRSYDTSQERSYKRELTYIQTQRD